MQRAFAERDRANDAMRQFIADAGHQLRTPLTVIRGFIAILRKGELRTPQDRERILETMHRQSALMSSLVDKLMLLDRWEDERERTASEPIDVSRLVSDVVAPLAEAHPGRDVRVDAPKCELAAIDPMELSHAVTNIVDNALKYTSGALEVAVKRDGKNVVVTVTDEGPGMTPAEVRHAFDRFFRGSRRDVDGTGLGLAIARRAIERAGGTLTLRSDPAAGSAFTIALPSAGSAERLPAPTPALR
jgi:two-component system OmpR family sensor kinase